MWAKCIEIKSIWAIHCICGIKQEQDRERERERDDADADHMCWHAQGTLQLDQSRELCVNWKWVHTTRLWTSCIVSCRSGPQIKDVLYCISWRLDLELVIRFNHGGWNLLLYSYGWSKKHYHQTLLNACHLIMTCSHLSDNTWTRKKLEKSIMVYLQYEQGPVHQSLVPNSSQQK